MEIDEQKVIDDIFTRACALNLIEKVEDNFRGNNRALALNLVNIVNELEDYHPLTVRQIFYQAVSKELIENNKNKYQTVSKNLTKLRYLDVVPWSAITDRTRRVSEKRGEEDLEAHLKESMGYLFDQYDRCLIQNQELYVEIFTEKDALSQVFEDVAWPYCIRVVVCRGQLSATFVKGYAQRATKANLQGKKPVIIYFGDLDPSGWCIPQAIVRNLTEHHGLKIELIRAALNPDQIIEFNLPHSVDAIKKKDPNYKRYVKVHGNTAVELDAIHPRDLKQLVKDALSEVLDIEDMLCQQDIQATERIKLKRLKERFLEVAAEEGIRLN